jgi:phenylalanyl-tRNA synthetase beta chain
LALNGYVEILPTPFCRRVFDRGVCRPTIRGDHHAVLNPLESDRPELATTLLPGLLEALAATCPGVSSTRAVLDRAGRRADIRNSCVELIPTDRRPTDDEIAAGASLPAPAQHVGVVLAGLREPAGPWGPGRPVEAATRSRRCGSSAGPPASS